MRSAIQLDKSDYRIVRPVAIAVSEYWASKSGKNGGHELACTLAGLFAEYAVIKFLNKVMGANPPIAFNTHYKNGGDSGRDFIFEKRSFDVKSTAGEKISDAQVKKTKADIVIVANKMGHGFYNIWGFAPISRLCKPEYTPADFLPMEELKIVWSKNFAPFPLPCPGYKTDLESINSIVNATIRGLLLCGKKT